jgi:DNA invertase Pin-like site-specific DNA recombinase
LRISAQRQTPRVFSALPFYVGILFRCYSDPEVASGAKTDRAQLRRTLDHLAAGDVLMVTRLDRLARSTLDLLHTLKTVADKGAGFRSLADAWADTTTAHGRLMLTILGGLAEFERELMGSE